MEAPDDRRYTEDDLWARPDGDAVRIGISDFAQDQLGEIVYVDLPDLDTSITGGEVMGMVESTKTMSDLVAPLSGRVLEVNVALESEPDVVNRSPYGDGWMVLVKPDDPAAIEGLMTAEAYRDARA